MHQAFCYCCCLPLCVFFVIAYLQSEWFVVAILSSILVYLRVHRYIKNNFENICIVVTVIEIAWCKVFQKFHYRKDGEKYLRVDRGKCYSSDNDITIYRHYYQYKSAKDFRKSIAFLIGIFYSNIAEITFKAHGKYCLLFKMSFLYYL